MDVDCSQPSIFSCFSIVERAEGIARGLDVSAKVKTRILAQLAGLDVATCGVANATGFGPTNFSRVVASLATAISSYYFLFAGIYFFIS